MDNNEIVGICKTCGNEIYEGETFYTDSYGEAYCSQECVFEEYGILERD